MSGFLKSKDGNFAIISAILLIPLIAAVGLGVDYTKATEIRTHAQDAADSAVLAAVAMNDASMGERKKLASKIFQSNIEQYTDGEVISAKLTKEKSGSSETYVFDVDVKYQTYFARIFGKDTVRIDVMAKAGIEQQAYDIVLVLDSTGSMSTSGKMSELKKAATMFVDSFPSSSGVRMAVVPFDTQVRLENVSFKSSLLSDEENPLDLSTDCSVIADPYDRAICEEQKAAAAAAGIPSDSCNTSTTAQGSNTVETTVCITYTSTTKSTQSTSITRNSAGSVIASSSSSTSESYTPPTGTGSLPGPLTSKTNNTITANNDLLGTKKDDWSGCVIDRTQPYDVSAESVLTKVGASRYPKAYCATDTLAPVLELTSQTSKVRKRIGELQPAGNTNLTIGVQWGMEALSPPSPLQVSGTNGRKKLMIVLTDGENTQNRWSTDNSAINSRTRKACENAKAADIEIMTIRLIDGNRALLKHCASDPGNYFEVLNSANLVSAFQAIAAKIKNVRLTG